MQSNSRPFRIAEDRREEFCFFWEVRLDGLWRAVFTEGLGLLHLEGVILATSLLAAALASRRLTANKGSE